VKIIRALFITHDVDTFVEAILIVLALRVILLEKTALTAGKRADATGLEIKHQT